MAIDFLFLAHIVNAAIDWNLGRIREIRVSKHETTRHYNIIVIFHNDDYRLCQL